ncbi:MAG: lipoprotein-releasing ABC transporter ATP-binding protein LolD [Gammaproteobacteria bacterium]|nr:lipoprotein-releasing ABC transporter ATP-binding protein LolD [Gammaproteobacteria bacterium]
MNSAIMEPVLQCKQVSKSFREGRLQVDVLKGIEFSVAQGERVAIIGSSGSGKSTLLHLLGGLEQPDTGEVRIVGQVMNKLTDAERGQLRNQALGFVYQFHHLLPEFTALENVSLPLLIRGLSTEEAERKATETLDQVGLKDRLHHKPGELSGGERQRTAIARALVTRPKCVLADEPTGNLDHRTADKVIELMLDLNKALKISFVIVTHDMSLAEKMDRIIRIEDGVLTQENN